MRVIKFACILCLCIFITSCSSLFTTTSSYSSSYSSSGNSNSSKPVYSAKSYVSCPTDFTIDKKAGILVVTFSNDSINRVILDKEFSNSFLYKGFTAAGATERIPSIKNSSDSEITRKAIEYIYNNDYRYLLYIFLGDTYTYTNGGGLSTVYFQASLLDREAVSLEVLSISGFVTCDKNEFQSYGESLEPAYRAIAKSVTDELVKYAK